MTRTSFSHGTTYQKIQYTIMQLDNAKARLEGMRKCGEYDNCQAIDIALVGLEELAKVKIPMPCIAKSFGCPTCDRVDCNERR